MFMVAWSVIIITSSSSFIKSIANHKLPEVNGTFQRTFLTNMLIQPWKLNGELTNQNGFSLGASSWEARNQKWGFTTNSGKMMDSWDVMICANILGGSVEGCMGTMMKSPPEVGYPNLGRLLIPCYNFAIGSSGKSVNSKSMETT